MNDIVVFSIEDPPSPTEDPDFDQILGLVQEAAARQQSGVGSDGFFPKVSLGEGSDNTPLPNPSMDTTEEILEPERIDPVLADEATAPSSEAIAENEAAAASIEMPLFDEPMLEKALADNRKQIEYTARWQWNSAPRVSQNPIGVRQFLELMKLGEKRLELLNHDETKIENVRLNRKPWFENKSKMERILFAWPSEKQVVFLNRIGPKRLFQLFELRKLHHQLQAMGMLWPMRAEQTKGLLRFTKQIERLMHTLLTTPAL